jgi:hypothetical protein
MDTDFTRQRLFNKAHVFEANAELCSRCGSSVAAALDTPFRCLGASQTAPEPKKPKTLTEALDSAEAHIIAVRAAAAQNVEPYKTPWSGDDGNSVPAAK